MRRLKKQIVDQQVQKNAEQNHEVPIFTTPYPFIQLYLLSLSFQPHLTLLFHHPNTFFTLLSTTSFLPHLYSIFSKSTHQIHSTFNSFSFTSIQTIFTLLLHFQHHYSIYTNTIFHLFITFSSPQPYSKTTNIHQLHQFTIQTSTIYTTPILIFFLHLTSLIYFFPIL